jgi:hypothetical protein
MDYSLMNRKALVSLCRERGIRHSRQSKEDLIRWLQNPGSQPPLDTEGTGKMFEMAICLANDTPFVSSQSYKYNLEKAERLRPRLAKLFETNKYVHTAKGGARYDFTSEAGYLSAKSNKDKDNGVAVQGIGQRKPKDFCDSLGIPYTTLIDLKQYIQSNIVSILPILVAHTFDCPILYYNEHADTIRHITLTKSFEWEKYDYTWSRPWDQWTNSSTLHIEKEGILEFQFHSKSRTNMAIRWRFEKMLHYFNPHFTIIHV